MQKGAVPFFACPCDKPYELSDCFVFDGLPSSTDIGYNTSFNNWKGGTFDFSQDYCLRNDFKTNGVKNNFWQKGNSLDMKWVLLLACFTMNNQGSGEVEYVYGHESKFTGFIHPRVRLWNLIYESEDGVYFSSACGFKTILTDELFIKGNFLKEYGEKLDQLAFNYGQAQDCYINHQLWEPDFENSKTTDPSVASFMETCAEWSKKKYNRDELNIDSACAIAKEGYFFYSWHILHHSYKAKLKWADPRKYIHRNDYRITRCALPNDPPKSKNF